MKKLITLIISLAIVLSAFALPSFAAARSETIDIHGVEILCDVSGGGILQILLSTEQQEQVVASFGEGVKADEKVVSIDLTGIQGLSGFAIRFNPWFSFSLEFMEDIMLFISPMAAMSIEDFSGGGEVCLEAVYSFDNDEHVSGINMSTTNNEGFLIKSVGVITLPVPADPAATQSMALERDGEVIAKSGVQDGLFYAAVSLSGSYTVVSAQPAEFEDEIPHWAKASVDYLSARDVIQGDGGFFRGNEGVTRAEFLTMLNRLYNPENTELGDYYKFKDMDDIPDWAIVGAHSMFMGVEHDGLLLPNQIMTREDILVTLRNYVLFADLFYDPSDYEMSFTDADAFSKDQSGAAWLMSRLGILEGFEDGSARMDETATRFQAAVILHRYSQWETLNRTYR